jgi:hypothetical protein
MGCFGLLNLPLRAPMLNVLFGVAVVMGHQWSMAQIQFVHSRTIPLELLFVAEGVQLLAVLVICTMPELLMQRLSLVMASSRVMTLLVTLLMVIVLGIYLLRLNLLSDLLILASALLLARLDLVRLGVMTDPRRSLLLLGFVLVAGIGLGHCLPHPLDAVVAPGPRTV